jgi:hypothetical protein
MGEGMQVKTRARSHKRQGFVRRHGLSLGVGGIVILLVMLYRGADPRTHLGGFYGNAIADWLGTFVIVVATKYLYEIGSAESRSPHPTSRSALVCFCVEHSLTIALIVTGAVWAAVFARMDPNGKSGQVVGNIVSEWTQILGLVVMTKYLGESGSKERR